MNTKFLMDNQCFACGTDNTHGLKLDIKKVNDSVRTKFKLPLWTQGYKKTVHGGIISTILDEMAVWAAFHKGFRCVTAELHMRIKKAMYVELPYIANARVTRIKHRLVETICEVTTVKNTLVASARVKLLRIDI